MLEIQLVCWGIAGVDQHNILAVGERNCPLQMLAAAVAGHTTAVTENRYSKNVNAISN